MVALPTWAEKMTPVDMDGAAALLGVSRRFLVDVLRTSPHYERRGIKKVFYPEHIARLREAICEQSHTSKVLSSSSSKGSITSMEPLADSAYDEALKLATSKPPSSLKPRSKPGYGAVISMAKRP